MAERQVQNLKTNLRCLIKNKKNWDKLLYQALFAIKKSESSTTGFSPSELVYEKYLMTSTNLECNFNNSNNQKDYHTYAENLLTSNKSMIQKAKINIKKSQIKRQKFYNQNIKINNKFKKGDYVYI